MLDKELYKQLGKNESEISSLFQDIKDIKSEIHTLVDNFQKLVYWKYKVTGIAAGVSMGFTLLTSGALTLVKRLFHVVT